MPILRTAMVHQMCCIFVNDTVPYWAYLALNANKSGLPMLNGFSTDQLVSQSCFVFHIATGHASKVLPYLQSAGVATDFSETVGEQLLADEREAAAKAAARNAKKLKQKAKKQHQKEQQKQSIHAEPHQPPAAESMHVLPTEISPVMEQLQLSALPGDGRQEVPNAPESFTIGQPHSVTSNGQQPAVEPQSSEADLPEAGKAADDSGSCSESQASSPAAPASPDQHLEQRSKHPVPASPQLLTDTQFLHKLFCCPITKVSTQTHTDTA